MARRKYGEGTVFQRKDGRWVAQVRLENGKMKQRYCKTEKEANKALRDMLYEKEKGMLPTGPNQMLKVYLEQWLEQKYKLSAIRASTYNGYRIRLHKHILPALGHIRLQKLTPQHLHAFYAKKIDEGYSMRSIRGLHSLLHDALTDAVKWSLVARNVCDLATSPTPKKHEMQPLTPEQAQHLLEVAQGHRLEVLLTVALATGMRRGELLGLHWQDIDFNEGCLYIRRSVSHVGKFGIREEEPKTQRGKRKIILPTFVIEALKQHQQRQQVEREKAGIQWKENDIVFRGARGGYITESILQTDFKRLLERAKLPAIRFHDLRHSTASFLAKLKVHPKVVQEMLGHSNISVTMDIYSHVFPSMQEEVVEKLDALFKKQ